MDYKFFDAFSALNLKEEEHEFFEETRITKLVSSSHADKLRIYLESDYIIPKNVVHSVEKAIRKQYNTYKTNINKTKSIKTKIKTITKEKKKK